MSVTDQGKLAMRVSMTLLYCSGVLALCLPFLGGILQSNHSYLIIVGAGYVVLTAWSLLWLVTRASFLCIPTAIVAGILMAVTTPAYGRRFEFVTYLSSETLAIGLHLTTLAVLAVPITAYVLAKRKNVT